MREERKKKFSRRTRDAFVTKLVLTAIRSVIKYSLRPDLARKAKRLYFSELTKQLTLIAQGFRCKMCGRFLDVVDFHHIDGNGANNLLSNCEALCPNCHAKKTRNIKQRKLKLSKALRLLRKQLAFQR